MSGEVSTVTITRVNACSVAEWSLDGPDWCSGRQEQLQKRVDVGLTSSYFFTNKTSSMV